MKRLILFREKEEIKAERNDDWPSIEDYVDQLDPDAARMIDNYFDRAGDWIVWMRPITEPYLERVSFPYIYYTDGVFIWDSVIRYWVTAFRIALPQCFLDHVASQNGRFPHVEWDQELSDRAKRAKTMLIDRVIESDHH